MKCSECKYVVENKWKGASGDEKVDYFCHRFPNKLAVDAKHSCGEYKKK